MTRSVTGLTASPVAGTRRRRAALYLGLGMALGLAGTGVADASASRVVQAPLAGVAAAGLPLQTSRGGAPATAMTIVAGSGGESTGVSPFDELAETPLACPPVEEDEEEVGYTDVSPLCHYLERGVDDQKPGTTSRHVIAAGEVRTLADIDRLAFGIDAPATHCQDNPHGVPCMEEELKTAWCIGKVRMSVLGMTIFELAAPGDDCLLDVRSGEGGPRSIDAFTLRSNPRWGFSTDELLELVSAVRFENGTPRLDIPGAFIPGTHLAGTIESAIGHEFARYDKGCANSNYCGDQRGINLRFAHSDDADCDQGGCPGTSERKSSPWVEVRGVDDHLEVDVDLSVWNATADPGDRVFDTEQGDWDYGNWYAQLAHGSLRVDLRLACPERARVRFPAAACTPPRDLPYCPVGAPEAPCFRRTSLQAGGKAGVIDCPPGSGDDACGTHVELESSRFDLSLQSMGPPTADIEGGLLDWAPDVACFLGWADACVLADADSVANLLLHSRVDESLLTRALFKDLDGCPAASIASDGTITVDMREPEVCPPGAQNPVCEIGFQIEPTDPHSGGGGPGATIVAVGSGGTPSALAASPAGPAPVQATFVATSGGGTPSWVSKLFSPALPEPSAGPVLGAGKLVAQTPVAAAAKKTFAEIEVALETGCAAARVCSDAFDLTELPLAAILEVDFAEVEALADAENYDAILQLLEPLVSSPEYVQHCLLHKYPDTNLSNPNLVRLANLLWLQAFQAERERIGSGSCANAVPPVETLIPASQIVLDIETRGDGVSDGYPFVNFFDLADHLDRPSAERERALKQYKCAHLEDFYLPSSDAPSCGNDGRIPDGPYAGEPCGTIAGGACADIAAGYYPYMWLYGQDYPEDQELHPNGDFSRHHRCAYDLETGGEMTCVRSTFLGAGVNETGVCKICGTPPANADPNDYTMVGCRSESTCPDGTDLWPDGRCWPSLGGLPEWMCEADCEHLYNGNGWCMHDISWRLMAEDLNPIMNEYSDTDYGHPICAERFCEGSGMACAGQGMACRPDEDVCEWECLSDADCQASDPLPAYPQGFVCDPDTFTCRLHFTAKP